MASMSYSACWQSFFLKKNHTNTSQPASDTVTHASIALWLGTNVLPISLCHLNYLKDAPISMHLESITGWTMASNLLATCYAEIILLGTAVNALWLLLSKTYPADLLCVFKFCTQMQCTITYRRWKLRCRKTKSSCTNNRNPKGELKHFFKKSPSLPEAKAKQSRIRSDVTVTEMDKNT